MMPKATSKSVHVSHTSANKGLEDFSTLQELSGNEFQEDSNIAHESSSEDEVEL